MTDEGKNRSCRTCPSFLDEEGATSYFNKDVGAPMCGRYGYVLGSSIASDDAQAALQVVRGTLCSSHGEPRPQAVSGTKLYLVSVADGSPETSDLSQDTKRCTSCALCKNYVPEPLVEEETGWFAGHCAARGRLIPANRTSKEARGCAYRSVGTNRIRFLGDHLFPEYQSMLAYVSSESSSSIYVGEVDPLAHQTDKSLSGGDEEMGIVAWRLIKDPQGYGPDTYLPIYDQARLGEEVNLVPRTGDDEHPELHDDFMHATYRLAVMWRELDETPALWGAAGLGKTETFRYMAWLMGLPFRRISITGSTEVDDLVGKTHYDPEQGTYWVDGRLPLAWRRPGVICIDEPNVGPPEVWQLIRPLTDNSKQLVLDQNRGERVLRDPNSYLGMAMNPSWDPRNVGTNMIGDADGSRLVHIQVPEPPEHVERLIVKRRVELDGWDVEAGGKLDLLMAVGSDIRDLVQQGTLAEISWGLRHSIKVARLLRWFDIVTSVRMATADYLPPELQQTLLDQVRAHADRPGPRVDHSKFGRKRVDGRRADGRRASPTVSPF